MMMMCAVSGQQYPMSPLDDESDDTPTDLVTTHDNDDVSVARVTPTQCGTAWTSPGCHDHRR